VSGKVALELTGAGQQPGRSDGGHIGAFRRRCFDIVRIGDASLENRIAVEMTRPLVLVPLARLALSAQLRELFSAAVVGGDLPLVPFAPSCKLPDLSAVFNTIIIHRSWYRMAFLCQIISPISCVMRVSCTR
jgi:hypothetical protein